MNLATIKNNTHEDEKYIQGGWQSRILLSLKSDLPNEVDWAYNKLVKLSYQGFYIHMLPSLQEILMEHSAVFFGQLVLNTSPNNFTTSSKSDTLVLTEISLLQSHEQAVVFERVLQILHIIRNLSFLGENAMIFSRDHALLTNLAKAIALPCVSYCVEIKQYAFDIFENMSGLIHLRGPSDFYFACLKKSLFDTDRAMILSSIRAMTRLTLNEVNEKVIAHLDSIIIHRLLSFLLLPDEELIVVVLEFFYNFSNLTEACAKMTSSVSFNIVKLLIRYIQYKPSVSPIARLPVQQQNDPLVNAALWLTLYYEKDLTLSIPESEFYAAYESYCHQNNKRVIPVSELLKSAKGTHGADCYSPGPPALLLLRCKVKQQQQPVPPTQETEALENDMDVDEQEQEPKDTWDCCWRLEECSRSFANRQALFEHLQTKHIPSSCDVYTCEWRKCQKSLPRRDAFLAHLAMHLSSNYKNPVYMEEQQEKLTSQEELSKEEEQEQEEQVQQEEPEQEEQQPQPQQQEQQQQVKTQSMRPPATPHNAVQQRPNMTPQMMAQQLPIQVKEQIQQQIQQHMHQLQLKMGNQLTPQVQQQVVVQLQQKLVQQYYNRMISTPGNAAAALPHPADELRGIPLTSLLILRNLARHPDNRCLFYPFEQSLTTLMANIKYCRMISLILAELRQ